MSTLDVAANADDPFALVVGQDRAVEQLRAAALASVHAYLFVGPRGAGKRRAAVALAGELVGSPADRERSRRLAKAEQHPDLVIFDPEGAGYLVDEVKAIIRTALMAPVESGSKVLVLTRFEDASADHAAQLLKLIEEPPPSTRFVLLATEVAPEHVTIASRSTRIEFPAVSVAAIAAALEERGADPRVALDAAIGSGGDVRRAELLISDEHLVARREIWLAAPGRLDGSGYTASEIVGEIVAAVDAAQVSLDMRQATDVVAMDETEELTGVRGSGRTTMDSRHKRERRLHRHDEMQMGLATLASRYRADVVDSGTNLNVFSILNDAAEALLRSPNEELWLTALMTRLPRISA